MNNMIERHLHQSKALALVFLATGTLLTSAFAQNMQYTVQEQRISFGKGKSSATIKGVANYGRSYVYYLRARKNQLMIVKLTSKQKRVTFSLFSPIQQGPQSELAFSVTEWKGKLPAVGDYKFVVVMNDKKATNVAYELNVAIK